MDFLPNVFVGSSKEGVEVANMIVKKLAGFADCTLWTEAFALGKSNFSNLTEQIAFYDYAILVATADDISYSKSKKYTTVRDNVLFEFGLFTGGLGDNRTFYFVEDGTKIPSDLLGITLPFFPAKTDLKFELSISDDVEKIKQHILNKEKTFDLGFLPSTAIAYGYFNNFVAKTVERLLEDKVNKVEFTLANNAKFQISDLKFTILIPDDLSNDMFEKVKAARLKKGWQKLKVNPKDVRDYDFSVDIRKISTGEFHLVDIPLTLNALYKAIEIYSKKQHLGKDVREKILEEREIRNFKKTLEYLINQNAFTKDIVSVEIVNI